MSIQSLEWLGWAALGVLGHWAVPSRWRDWYLIVFTLAFLCVYSPLSAIILLALTFLTFGLTRRRPVRGISVALLAVAIVGLLAIFKLCHGELQVDSGVKLIIPLGLSYYTLRCLHYAIESYKGTLKADTLLDFISYQFFFPTMIAGPIHRFPEFHRDQHRRRWDAQMFSRGLERILFGYTKIVVLGNFLVSQVFAKQFSHRANSPPHDNQSHPSATLHGRLSGAAPDKPAAAIGWWHARPLAPSLSELRMTSPSDLLGCWIPVDILSYCLVHQRIGRVTCRCGDNSGLTGGHEKRCRLGVLTVC